MNWKNINCATLATIISCISFYYLWPEHLKAFVFVGWGYLGGIIYTEYQYRR